MCPYKGESMLKTPEPLQIETRNAKACRGKIPQRNLDQRNKQAPETFNVFVKKQLEYT